MAVLPSPAVIAMTGGILLANLPQVCIDALAKFLSLEDLLKLQQTCKSLFIKCLVAQRLLYLDPCYIHFTALPRRPQLVFNQFDRKLCFMERHFRAAKFRVRAQRLICEEFLTDDAIRHIGRFLYKRGTVEKLYLENDIQRNNPRIFNDMLKKLRIRELSVQTLPMGYLELPAVKHLRSLEYLGPFPRDPKYLSEAMFPVCHVTFDYPHPSTEGLRLALENWTKGRGEIDDWDIAGIDFAEYELFHTWNIIDDKEEEPKERPLVTRLPNFVSFMDSYRFIYSLTRRKDEKKLYIHYEGDRLQMRSEPFEEDEDDEYLEEADHNRRHMYGDQAEEDHQ